MWMIQMNQVWAKCRHEALEAPSSSEEPLKELLQAGWRDWELQSHTVTLHSCRPSHKHRAAAGERNPARWTSLTDTHRCVSVCVSGGAKGGGHFSSGVHLWRVTMWLKFSGTVDHTDTEKHAWNYTQCRRGVVVAAAVVIVVVTWGFLLRVF